MSTRLTWLVQYFVAGIAILGGGIFPGSELSAEEQQGVRLSLFNGQDLSGWTAIHCQAGVENGLLVLQDGNGLLRTDHSYDDFILELEWRPRKAEAFDSGVYFRCQPPAPGENWPQRYQVNLQQGKEGNLIGSTAAAIEGLVKQGDWNHLRLTVVGDTAELEINGQHAWRTSGLDPSPGYIGLQVETPLGGQFEFRNLFVTELRARSLFNGQDLAGWEGADQDASACWRVEEGLLVCTGEKGPWLRCQQPVADFNLRLEYLLLPGGNSGVYVRVPDDGNHHGPGSGVEIQLLDDAHERYRNLKAYQYSASVYDIAPADPHVSRPAGEWNSLEIDCSGPSYRIVHNGVVVVDAEPIGFPLLNERLLAGRLGLQNHSETVKFRNLRLAPSQRAAPAAAAQ